MFKENLWNTILLTNTLLNSFRLFIQNISHHSIYKYANLAPCKSLNVEIIVVLCSVLFFGTLQTCVASGRFIRILYFHVFYTFIFNLLKEEDLHFG